MTGEIGHHKYTFRQHIKDFKESCDYKGAPLEPVSQVGMMHMSPKYHNLSLVCFPFLFLKLLPS